MGKHELECADDAIPAGSALHPITPLYHLLLTISFIEALKTLMASARRFFSSKLLHRRSVKSRA
jgi:hypothetical protein